MYYILMPQKEIDAWNLLKTRKLSIKGRLWSIYILPVTRLPCSQQWNKAKKHLKTPLPEKLIAEKKKKKAAIPEKKYLNTE